MLVQFSGSADFPPLLPPFLNDAGRLGFVTGEALPLEVPVVPAPGKGTTLNKNRQVMFVPRECCMKGLPSVGG